MPDFTLELPNAFLAQDSGDLVDFDSVDGCAYEGVVKGFQGFLGFEQDVCGVFDLHKAKVVGGFDFLDDGAVEACIAV